LEIISRKPRYISGAESSWTPAWKAAVRVLVCQAGVRLTLTCVWVAEARCRRRVPVRMVSW
jgi:hypothetical protein